MKHISILFIILLAGCDTGDWHQRCNADGKCNGELICEGNFCQNDGRIPPVSAKPTRKCFYESECFCTICAEKCGDSGVKLCAFSDTSVWGSKPAVCECK